MECQVRHEPKERNKLDGIPQEQRFGGPNPPSHQIVVNEATLECGKDDTVIDEGANPVDAQQVKEACAPCSKIAVLVWTKSNPHSIKDPPTPPRNNPNCLPLATLRCRNLDISSR